ncbi:IS630 family transposase [Mucilaginibacter sp. R-33]|uniref:IS630 family transposase n=1 Tax=Mucilaginibacter sp. R-33 TaxID=3416711 RepID=UPI003CF64A57
MARTRIPEKKQISIGRMLLNGAINIRQTSRRLAISRNTVKSYIKKYKAFADNCPGEAVYRDVGIPVFKIEYPRNDKYQDLINVLPLLIGLDKPASAKDVWLRYLAIYPNGYNRSAFCQHFSKWLKENKVVLRNFSQVLTIPAEDLKILKRWRRSSDRRKWERSVVIMESFHSKSAVDIAIKVDRGADKVSDWIRDYKAKGIKGLEKQPRRANKDIINGIKEKRDNLVRLIHESPKLHGINRTSWFLADLSAVYQKVYGIYISGSTISAYLKKEGYVYRKAKEVLTSPDPNFREKMDKITAILQNLGSREKFFSVDEFGPFAVKMKGGRSLVKRSERKTFPQIQKSKGWTICTAALELSQNQITHFYSQKKETEEMIKLIDLLPIKYQNEEKLYFSWDAASWHASKKLVSYIEQLNSESYRLVHKTPLVELAPLPASAQFLNVIESVFSGLAKSIIHNSDYTSLDECKAAITLYFQTRNNHFILNPQKAGNKIWGKELVVPTFKDSHNCKDPKYR